MCIPPSPPTPFFQHSGHVASHATPLLPPCEQHPEVSFSLELVAVMTGWSYNGTHGRFNQRHWIVEQLQKLPTTIPFCRQFLKMAHAFKIIISSQKLKCGRILTTSQYTITTILYFKTQRTVLENAKVT